MNWWHYLIGYYVLCLLICVCIALYNTNKRDNKDDWGTKNLIRLLVFGPFVLPIGAFLLGVSGLMEFQKKRKKKHEFIAKYGFSPDEHYECFSMMGGVGVIVCEECGYKEKIVSFIHGFRHSDTGRQCPNCYAFTSEHNVSDNDYSFGKSESDFLCPRCGTIIRKKEESIFKGDDVPLYCPKCHSHKLHYHCEYIT
ncbi:hypothetical protein [Prevotella sp. RM4]|uniref:hypothetical protein n=1 Tax=Prevotella sp. RM4 TaxID=1200547 RepID=UPI0012ED00BB|nr:hypothetical protein [Prevotella sp. RM4]